jgi:hypothetical protein
MMTSKSSDGVSVIRGTNGENTNTHTIEQKHKPPLWLFPENFGSDDTLFKNTVLGYRLSNGASVSVADWIRILSDDSEDNKAYSNELAKTMTEILRKSPFRGFRFETKGVTAKTASDTPFEFAIVDDSHLANFADQDDPVVFAEYVSSPQSSCISQKEGCVFPNLEGDSILIAPKEWPTTNDANNNHDSTTSYHGHLAKFVRNAPDEQITMLWKLVAKTLGEKLAMNDKKKHSKDQPVWLSTAGDGVAWLHFRLDPRPKYYHYLPFAKKLTT